MTGQSSTRTGRLRAGDCSFNNLGVTTYFMLTSTMPDDLLAEKGYHMVGGCGGNIAWHTEDDTLEIADRDNLLRDMRVYAAAVLRALNAPIAPVRLPRDGRRDERRPGRLPAGSRRGV